MDGYVARNICRAIRYCVFIATGIVTAAALKRKRQGCTALTSIAVIVPVDVSRSVGVIFREGIGCRDVVAFVWVALGVEDAFYLIIFCSDV